MKTAEVFGMMKETLEKVLNNINEVNIRNEYKLRILTGYALPSLRYMLTVHDLHDTHLKSLDTLLDKYIKQWIGIPSRGANIALVHTPEGFNIPTISDLYQTCHCLAYSRSRVKGDDLVQHALDQQLEREEAWLRQSSTIKSAHAIHCRIPNSRD